MKIIIEDSNIKIESRGIEFLKLKTLLVNKIGSNFRTLKSTIILPIGLLDVLQSIPEFASRNELNVTSEYIIHSKARETALLNYANHSVLGIDNTWKSILDVPQQYAVSAMITDGLLGLCLFDEQGSGKTVMAISAFDILHNAKKVDSLLIVCPKSMIAGWKEDIKKFLKAKYSIGVLDDDKRRETLQSNKDIIISNYEGLNGLEVIFAAASKIHKYLLIIDESYYAKNEKSHRSGIIKRIRDCCCKAFVLCGTPAPNNAYDIVNQLNLADKGFTFSLFSPTGEIDKDREAIRNFMHSRGMYIRRQKTEILKFVPKKVFEIVKVKLQGRQKLLYEKARDSLVLELKAYDNSTFKKNLKTYFQKRQNLLQICSVPSAVDILFSENNVKYEAVDTILKKLIPENKKVIIWSFYTVSICEMVKRYSKYNPVFIDGSVSTEQRAIAVNKFQNDPDTHLFIGNPSAAGAGITLHASYNAIYVSYSNQAAHFLQSIDRIHRRGQNAEKVYYYFIVCQNTIEEAEISHLQDKENDQHDLLGDKPENTLTLESALCELLEKQDNEQFVHLDY